MASPQTSFTEQDLPDAVRAAAIMNRRAIMVAATAYLIGAAAWYFQELSSFHSVAIALVLIGCLFLAMAVGWSAIRTAAVRYVPNLIRSLLVPA